MVTAKQGRKMVARGSHGVRGVAMLGAVVVLAACMAPVPQAAEAESFLATAPMRWDHRAEADSWTATAMAAVARKDAVLAGKVPADIEGWCPGYAEAPLQDRRAFWVGLMSAVAKHESGWNPAASGGGGRYIGLMQISPGTARHHGCAAQSAGALKDGGQNLACAVEIFAEQVGADGMVAGRGNRGLGRDWGPFKKSSKRSEMAAWTAAQPWCQG